MRNRFTLAGVLCAGLLLTACQTGADLLTNLGVSPASATTIAADTATAGQLFCSVDSKLLAVSGVNVIGASAATVAAACAVAQLAGGLTPPTVAPVPVAAPAGAIAQVVTVGADVIAAVNASKSAS